MSIAKLELGNILLERRLTQGKGKLLKGKNYRHIDRGGSVLGVCHCDTVHCNVWNDIAYDYRREFVFNTQLDDRLGVFIILDLLPTLGVKCDVLLTDDEEIGQSTAELFTPSKAYNWIFSFDRRGTDTVTYHYDDMLPYAEKYFDIGRGSFSDITSMSLPCGGLNIGTGYYNEHTTKSYANLHETRAQLAQFVKFYNEFSSTFIPTTEQKYFGYSVPSKSYGYYGKYRESFGASETSASYSGDTWKCDSRTGIWSKESAHLCGICQGSLLTSKEMAEQICMICDDALTASSLADISDDETVLEVESPSDPDELFNDWQLKQWRANERNERHSIWQEDDNMSL